MSTNTIIRGNQWFEDKLNKFVGKTVKNAEYATSMLDGRVTTVFLDFTDGSTLRIQAQSTDSARSELTI